MNDIEKSLWDNFKTTGTVDDYLKYKSVSDYKQGEDKNEYKGSGDNSKRNDFVNHGGW